MTWLAICLPLMVIGLAIATVPIVYAMHHQHRYGLDVKPRPETGTTSGPPTTTGGSELVVCPDCSALIMDRGIHARAVHRPLVT